MQYLHIHMLLGILHCFLVHFNFAQSTFHSPIHYKYKRVKLQDTRTQVYHTESSWGVAMDISAWIPGMHVGGKCQKCQMYGKLTSCRYNTVSQKNPGTSQMHQTCTQTPKALWMTWEDLHTCQKQSETPKTIQMHQTFLVEVQHLIWYKNNCKNALKCQKEQTEMPTGAKIWHMGKADSLENIADMYTECTDVQNVAKNPKTAENANENVKTCEVRPMRQTSSYNLIVMLKRAGRCKHISNNRIDTCIQQNTPIKVLEMQIKKITLGELLRHWKQSRKLAVSVEGKMTEVELTKEVVE